MPTITIKFRPGSETAKMFMASKFHTFYVTEGTRTSDWSAHYETSILHLKALAEKGAVFTFSHGPGEGIDGAAGVAWGGKLFVTPTIGGEPAAKNHAVRAGQNFIVYDIDGEHSRLVQYHIALARADAEINRKEGEE